MVDVGEKPVTRREALARGAVKMEPATLEAIVGGRLKKGEALAAARLAGIMAAKRTHELIPLCHQIALEVVEIEFRPDPAHATLHIQARAATASRTGVEMEALVALSAAALTIYDMAKAIDRAMTIDAIRLVGRFNKEFGNVTDEMAVAIVSLSAQKISCVQHFPSFPGPKCVNFSSSEACPKNGWLRWDL